MTYWAASEAMKKVLKSKPGSVLDVGCGKGAHSWEFKKAGWQVHGVDITNEPNPSPFCFYNQSLWQEMDSNLSFDCVWASHVLEHQLNVNSFLSWCKARVRPGGLIAITVPPLKQQIVGGHVSVWNMGLLLYNMVLAGIDCSEAQGLKYGYNISIIVPYTGATLPPLKYDAGDIETIAHLLPNGHKWVQGFDGDIENINWR